MPSSTTASKSAGTAARPDQVPRQRGQQAGSTQQKSSADDRGISMPSIPIPHVRIPAGTAGNVIWWGGLAAVAALGIVDWPVAALVAAGTWVAEQHARQPDREAAAR